MLYTEEAVKANIRNRAGKRVFYLGKADTLTPGARDWLRQERIEILDVQLAKPERYALAGGGYLEEKPEHMTHLRGNLLVPKTHPRIAFRGAMDTLEAELILSQLASEESLSDQIGEVLTLARNLIRWEVMEEPVVPGLLCGLSEEELRQRSHRPQDYYGQPHFMPDRQDGPVIARLNRARCAAREAERAAAQAFLSPEGAVLRPDILTALNRMSSMLYILMIQEKSGRKEWTMS